ncbi:MAG: hypothetical protein KDB40_03195 [Acidimicrobiales bacterium]|nr:hypothetical protein [Acidimicrobiales bacterium]
MATTPTPTADDEAPAVATPVGGERTSRLALHPSSALPGVPPFVFSVPEGWTIDQAPGALAVVRPRERIAEFWVTAVLSHDRVARSVDFKQAASFTWDRVVKQVPDAKVTFEKFFRRGDVPFYVRGSELVAPRSARPIAQLHAIWFAPARDAGKLVDFFQLVGTAPVESTDEVGPALFEIITSFRFV